MKTVVICLLILGLAAPALAQITIIPQSPNPLNSLLQHYQTKTNPQQQSEESGGFQIGTGNPFFSGMHNNQFNDIPNSPNQPFYGNTQPGWSQGFFGPSRSPFGRR